MAVDKSMTSTIHETTANKKWIYEAPHFERHDLLVVTLGGSPGSGDSGATNTQLIPGDPTGERGEKGFEEDWDNGS